MGSNQSQEVSSSQSSFTTCDWSTPLCTQSTHSYSSEGNGGNGVSFSTGTAHGPFGAIPNLMAIAVVGTLCLTICVAIIIHTIKVRRRAAQTRSILACTYTDYEQGKCKVDPDEDIGIIQALSPRSKAKNYKYNLKRLFSLKASVPMPTIPGTEPMIMPERRVTLMNLNVLLEPQRQPIKIKDEINEELVEVNVVP